MSVHLCDIFSDLATTAESTPETTEVPSVTGGDAITRDTTVEDMASTTTTAAMPPQSGPTPSTRSGVSTQPGPGSKNTTQIQGKSDKLVKILAVHVHCASSTKHSCLRHLGAAPPKLVPPNLTTQIHSPLGSSYTRQKKFSLPTTPSTLAAIPTPLSINVINSLTYVLFIIQVPLSTKSLLITPHHIMSFYIRILYSTLQHCFSLLSCARHVL